MNICFCGFSKIEQKQYLCRDECTLAKPNIFISSLELNVNLVYQMAGYIGSRTDMEYENWLFKEKREVQILWQQQNIVSQKKSKGPRAFVNTNTCSLLVHYYSQHTGWMNRRIFQKKKLLTFWKSLNIKDSIYGIANAWNLVKNIAIK